jgi:site-specific recombinase XerC
MVCESRTGLTAAQGKRSLPYSTRPVCAAKPDYAMVAVLLGCGLRKSEVAWLAVESLQQREEHWVIADMIGKGGHGRSQFQPSRGRAAVDNWIPHRVSLSVLYFGPSIRPNGLGTADSLRRSFGAW